MIVSAMKQALQQMEYVMYCINNAKFQFVENNYHETMHNLRAAIHEAEKNDFYPDWNTTQPLLDRITELEKQDIKCAGCNRQASYGYALYCVQCSQPMREWLPLTDEQIVMLLRRVTIEANLDMLYTTEGGMKTFALQLQQLLKEQNETLFS